MAIYRIQRLFSWNSWIDKKIRDSEERTNKIVEENHKYRNSPETEDEKRISKLIREKAKSEGVEVIDTPKSRGGGFTPNIKFIPKDKIEKFGIDPSSLKENKKYILANPTSKPYILAHEHGHSKEDIWSRNLWKNAEKNQGKIGAISGLLEETRANVRAYKELKDLHPNSKTWKESKKGLLNIEKNYLEGAYRKGLEKLKTKEFSQGTVTVYHTTKIVNLDSIYKHGILTSYQKDRDFENKSLGLGLTKLPVVYLSKSLEHLCIPAVSGKRVVLQIDIPRDIYMRWDRINKGDPMYQYFIKNKYKFGGSWKNFCYYMYEEMSKQNPKLKLAQEQEVKEYGSLENTPRFKHALNSINAICPEACLMTTEDIKPEWIRPGYLTEEDLARKGIYFGR